MDKSKRKFLKALAIIPAVPLVNASQLLLPRQNEYPYFATYGNRFVPVEEVAKAMCEDFNKINLQVARSVWDSVHYGDIIKIDGTNSVHDGLFRVSQLSQVYHGGEDKQVEHSIQLIEHRSDIYEHDENA